MSDILRQTMVELRDQINEHLDKGYIPGPEFLPRLRDRLELAINRDTIENIGRCTRNDWCRAPLDHEGDCQPLENAEQIFDFFSKDGQVKVEIIKRLNEPAQCKVSHRGVTLFQGQSADAAALKPSGVKYLPNLESDDAPAG